MKDFFGYDLNQRRGSIYRVLMLPVATATLQQHSCLFSSILNGVVDVANRYKGCAILIKLYSQSPYTDMGNADVMRNDTLRSSWKFLRCSYYHDIPCRID